MSISQRGFTRPSGRGVDMGAYEAGDSPPMIVARQNGSTLDLSFVAEADVTYELQISTDLRVWEVERVMEAQTNGLIVVSVPMTQLQQFFRLRME